MSVLDYLPAFDGQTIFTSVVGGVFSFVTFVFGYRKTVGARHERIKIANQELISSVLRRVAVEREMMDATQFSFIREAKAYRTTLQLRQLIEFKDALSVVLSEIIDNNFLDQPSKNTIIGLLSESRHSSDQSIKESLPLASVAEPNFISPLFIGSVVALVGGFSTSFVYVYLRRALDAAGSVADKILLDWIPGLIVAALIVGLAVSALGYLSARFVDKKKREAEDTFEAHFKNIRSGSTQKD